MPSPPHFVIDNGDPNRRDAAVKINVWSSAGQRYVQHAVSPDFAIGMAARLLEVALRVRPLVDDIEEARRA